MNCPQNPSVKKKGCSKRACVILASVEEATWNLLDKGEKIAKEAPVLMEELNGALHEVRKESKPDVTQTIIPLLQQLHLFFIHSNNVFYDLCFVPQDDFF